MTRKKLTPKKKPKRAPPAKLKNTKKANAKGGHDASFQQRMEICVLAARGASIREIVESLGYTKYMAVRSSKRSEEVMKTGSVESKPKKNAGTGRKSAYSTPEKEETVQEIKDIVSDQVYVQCSNISKPMKQLGIK